MKRSILVFGLILITVTILSGQLKKPLLPRSRSGYVNINELNAGYGWGNNTRDYSKYFFGVTTTHGYQMNIYSLQVKSSLSGGIGGGILFYDAGALIPIFGDFRYTINKGNVSPYISARGGLLLNIKDMTGQQRLFVNGGGGVYIKINNKLAINVGPGFSIQTGILGSRDSFINLNLGIVFKPR